MSKHSELSEATPRDLLRKIDEQDALIRELLLEKHEPIAIVGAGLRFPGGNESLRDFDEFLAKGQSGIRPLPESRRHMLTGSDPEDTQPVIGGFLDEIDRFDAAFFNISPREAAYLDPQQRMVLETAWQALENASIPPGAWRHREGGVYMGVSSFDYALDTAGVRAEEVDSYIGTGLSHSSVPGRLSYLLGWRGPSISVDTACSSSLVALHLAVQGLRNKECGIALCGGVNLIHNVVSNGALRAANMLSPDGRCKTFDDSADGYARGEGCGVLVLKRLSDAERDGDSVLALVRGTAVRQDGESAGLTVPNGQAQEQVMGAALAAAGLEPGHIQYVEAHGTGTPLGDPIEMGSIAALFAASHDKAAPVTVGSVKTNIGHLEGAAGMAGLVKTVLQLQAGKFYPHLNFERPSGRIPWERYPVTVPTGELTWEGTPRRALVNGFGFAGTIATAVLEQAPAHCAGPALDGHAESSDRHPGTDGKRGHVFTLSAKNDRSLRSQIRRYQQFLTADAPPSLADICFTSNTGRAHHKVRLAGAVASREELAQLLDRRLHSAGALPVGGARKAAFLFSGQGSQFSGMAAALYRRFPVFRERVDECDRILRPLTGRSMRDMLVGTDDHGDDIHETRYSQPALFCLEYALAELWTDWGVRPSVLVGHSIGELVAATVAGVFSLEDGARIAAERGRLMQSVSTPGAMAAVAVAAEEIGPLLGPYDDLALAAINAPDQCVVSGGSRSLEALLEDARRRDIRVKRLPVSHAFHSPLMAEVADEFRALFEGIHCRAPRLPVISALTGKVARASEFADPAFWVRHLLEPVDFLGAVQAVERRGTHAFVEIGPSASLISLARRCVTRNDHLWAASSRAGDEDGATIDQAVASLYMAGLSVDWAAYHRGTTHRRVDLPTYTFDRKRYWLPSGTGPAPSASPGPLPEAPPAAALEEESKAVAPESAGWPADASNRAINEAIRRELVAILRYQDVEDIEPDADFASLGLDSLTAVSLKNRLEQVFAVSLPTAVAFEQSRIDLLAGSIRSLLIPSSR
ncbi:beta-ketoacyl synthase N-terminal-like domain-containing protein [Streptomyces olivaceoviridis]|uniref:type I polyketide synthase n=1 Tax=Streptomyces olivaceoviridis TaxID=1921 RepID=UPI0033A11E2A